MNYCPLLQLHPGYLDDTLLFMLTDQHEKLKLKRPDYFDRQAAGEFKLRKRHSEEPVRAAIKIDLNAVLQADTFTSLFRILRSGSGGRIPIPSSNQQFWAHYKYSVMARDPNGYATIGRRLADPDMAWSMDELGGRLAEQLSRVPPPGRLQNTLQHLWGYLDHTHIIQPRSPGEQLRVIQQLSYRQNIPYLLHSTALSDFGLWIN